MDLAELTRRSLQTFLTMFVVMDPIGLAPFFIGLAGHMPREQRRQIALRATTIAGGIILLFGLAGKPVLEHLGISMNAFRVAGGLLLFLIALEMIFNIPGKEKSTDENGEPTPDSADIGVFPLAIPLIAGPGTLAASMIQVGEAHGDPMLMVGVFAATFVVLLLCYLAMRVSGPLGRMIGASGLHVVTRVLGVLLAALAVQYVADGIIQMLPTATPQQ